MFFTIGAFAEAPLTYYINIVYDSRNGWSEKKAFSAEIDRRLTLSDVEYVFEFKII